MAEGSVDNTSLNRSLEAYQANVDANLYPPTDNSVTVLRFERLDGKEFGMISWFAVHTTSMFYGHDKSFENPNGMISSDNKGWSELKFEKAKGTDYWGEEETFIASFSNSTLGDVSPNVLGGQEGGGINDFASTHISGDKQFQKTWELYHNARRELSPRVHFRHTFKDYSKVTVAPEYTDGQERKTSYAAIGLAFAAGAEDGPSKIPYIKEGLYKGKYHESHGLKPIFLETGKMEPYPWTPEVLSVQMFTIGNVALLAVPGEFTTHCGRRIKETIASDMEQMGVDTMIICGPANAYAGYVATREEYNEQHYEGASTHFGQWTLGAFRQEFKALSSSLVNGTIPENGPQPRDLTGKQSSLQPEVVFDAPALGMEFGDLHKDAPKTAERLSVLEVIFCGAHPNNTLKTNDSFLQVERKTEDGWKAVRYDYNVDTAFSWERHGIAASKIKILWDIQEDVPAGTYRIKHSGKYKGAFSDKTYPLFLAIPENSKWFLHKSWKLALVRRKGKRFIFNFTIPNQLLMYWDNALKLLAKDKFVSS